MDAAGASVQLRVSINGECVIPALCRLNVRGLNIATGQYSSFCGCALGLMLGDLDNMGVEVQDRK